MRDVNSLSPNRPFNVGLTSAILCLALIVEMSCVVFVLIHFNDLKSMPTGGMLLIIRIGFISALFFLCYLIFLAATIHRCVLNLSRVSGHVTDVVKNILLSLPWFLSLPYLQSKVNLLLLKQAS